MKFTAQGELRQRRFLMNISMFFRKANHLYLMFQKCQDGLSIKPESIGKLRFSDVFMGLVESETHSESSQTSKMERFAKIVNGLTIFAKRSVLDVGQGSECACRSLHDTFEASRIGVKKKWNSHFFHYKQIST